MKVNLLQETNIANIFILQIFIFNANFLFENIFIVAQWFNTSIKTNSNSNSKYFLLHTNIYCTMKVNFE